jgi:predicted nucleic acid-binding protein
MKYLLDTNIIVDYLRGKSKIEEILLKEGSAISIITLSELYYGAFKSNDSKRGIKEIKETMADLNLGVIELGESVKIYGKIKSLLEKKGNRLEDIDLFIAATALSSSLTIVTNNKKHFKRIPKLKLY